MPEGEAETPENGGAGDTGAGTDKPDMTAADMADFDPDDAAAIESEFGSVDPAEDGADPADMGGMGDAPAGDMGDMDLPDGAGLGDFYCRALSLLAHVVSEKYGDGDSDFYDEDAEPGEKIDTTLAKELQLDVHVDRLMAQRGVNDLPPGKALVLGTIMFSVTVAATQPSIVQKLTDEI